MSAWNQKWPAMSRAEKMAILRPLVQPTPDRDDPAFDEADAMANVADRLHESRDTGEILGDLADAADWLAWISDNYDLPKGAQQKVDWLAKHAKRLHKLRAREHDDLNGDPR